MPRTFQINAPASAVSKITDDDATCAAVSGGTRNGSRLVDYTDKSGMINKVTPNRLVYWVKVTAPAGPRTLQVDQSITSGNFTRKLDLGAGSIVFNAACAKVKRATVTQRCERLGQRRLHRVRAPGPTSSSVRYLVTLGQRRDRADPDDRPLRLLDGWCVGVDERVRAEARSGDRDPLAHAAFFRLLSR